MTALNENKEKKTMKFEDYITTKEAAEKLGVSDQMIRNWAKNGAFSCVGTRKNLFLVDRKQFEKFVESMSHTFKEAEEMWEETTREKARKQNELQDELDKLETQKAVIGCQRVSNHLVLKDPYTRLMLLEIIKSARFDYDTPFTDREATIMEEIVNGSSLRTIGETIGLTRERVRQIFCRGIQKIKDVAYRTPEIISENKKLRESLVKQRSHIKELQEEIAGLRRQVKVKPRRNKKKNDAQSWTMNVILRESDLPIRALNCLTSVHIETLWDLLNVNKFDLLKIRCMGRKTLSEIEDFMESFDKDLRIGMFREPET